MSQTVQLAPLKEPELSGWGLTLNGREHVCKPQWESKTPPVFKATPAEQAIGETIWLVDGSSYYTEGKRVTGFAGICFTGNRQRVNTSQYKLIKGGTRSAEVSAALEVLAGMKNKQTELIIGTDSEYVYKGTTVYLPGWNRNRWI